MNHSTIKQGAPQPSPLWQQMIWKLTPGTTVGRALISAKQRLEDANCDTPHLDAQVILAHVLGVERSWLFAHHEYELPAARADAYATLIMRRMRHEPVAYLVGRKEFYGLEFAVDHRVLIPRPETELLVDAVLDTVDMRKLARPKIADVGTGSGAIAIAVAANCANARIYAIDISPDALAVARENVERLDAHQQVILLVGDLLAPLPEKVDILVANLPYISSAAYQQLMADVHDFEPQLALEAGPQGLDAITRLLQQAADYLLPEGVILLEIGYDQGATVEKLAQTRFPTAQSIRVRQDYHGHDRLVMIILERSTLVTPKSKISLGVTKRKL
jgi:release factor glutamine methyltransferase